jgi:hypothetical protein
MSNVVHKNMSRWAIFHIIIAMSMFALSMTMMLNNPAVYQQSLDKELYTTMQNVGDDSWGVIERRTRERHKENWYDNGLFELLVRTLISERDDHITRNIKESDDIQAKVVNNLQVLSYQVFFRLTVLEYWMAILTPLCLCIIISGYYLWKKKRYQMGGTSTGKGRIWMKVAWLLFVGFVVMLIVPPYVVSLSVYTPVLFFLFTSLAISNYISNFAKEF